MLADIDSQLAAVAVMGDIGSRRGLLLTIKGYFLGAR